MEVNLGIRSKPKSKYFWLGYGDLGDQCYLLNLIFDSPGVVSLKKSQRFFDFGFWPHLICRTLGSFLRKTSLIPNFILFLMLHFVIFWLLVKVIMLFCIDWQILKYNLGRFYQVELFEIFQYYLSIWGKNLFIIIS